MQENRMINLVIMILSIAMALAFYNFFMNKGNKEAKKDKSAQVETTYKLSGKGEDIKIATEKMLITLSTEGGIIKSVKLKEYKKDNSREFVELAPDTGLMWNISNDKEIQSLLTNSLYTYKIKETEDKIDVEFALELKNGTSFQKKYSFDKKGYTFVLSQNLNGVGVSIGPEIAPQDRKSSYSFSGPIIKEDKKTIEAKLNKNNQEKFSNFKWASWQSLYFTVTVIPENQTDLEVVKIGEGKYYMNFFPKGQLKATIFIGPKDYNLLKNFNLEDNIRFGIFAPISKLLISIMHFFHRMIPNWGVSIILLTILVKIILHPLTVKGYKSMNKIKEVQPEIQRLKEIYKEDPAKLNQALMELYKKHNINPFGGCLPLLLQIPVFFALYKTIAISIDLRHAPFILWITDLSSKDPYYITPILVGITMLIQQLLTSTSLQDDTQKLMTYGMPILFTAIFISLPSGLVLYFLVNNLISILEQIAIKHVYS
ncbi:MAG: membrane protein insertase YidC [candidate division WOR-3 bacterium]